MSGMWSSRGQDPQVENHRSRSYSPIPRNLGSSYHRYPPGQFNDLPVT